MDKPIVAIVGRPNVGKSSLFNRIIGKRIAVVHDTPGVTRDRLYADVEWDDKTFTIVDTGGMEVEPDDDLTKMVQLQVQTAIDEAQVILFVVDVVDGIMPQDAMIADLLRKTEKPIFLVANKSDNLERDYDAAEFYQFGLGTPMPVSAIHDAGIGDLMDEVAFAIEEKVYEETTEPNSLKIAVVGRPNAGKSSLINAILGEERVIVAPEPGTTRDAINISFIKDGVNFELVDTAGMRRKARVKDKLEKYSVSRAQNSIRKSDIAWLVLDTTREVAQQDKAIAKFIFNTGKACILAATKWDLVEKDNQTHNSYMRELQRQLSIINFAPVLFVSSKTLQRVMQLPTLSLAIHREYSMRIPTHQLNLALRSAVAAHQPPIVRNKRPSLKYITQVAIQPPTLIIFTNHPKGINPSYETYLINRFRDTFGFQGAPIKIWFRQS